MAWVDLGVFQGHTQAPNLRKKIVSKNKYSSQVYRPSDPHPHFLNYLHLPLMVYPHIIKS